MGNTLAFGLLKIIFIIALILIIGAMTTSYGIFSTVRNLATLLELPAMPTPMPNKLQNKVPNHNSNIFRKNSF